MTWCSARCRSATLSQAAPTRAATSRPHGALRACWRARSQPTSPMPHPDYIPQLATLVASPPSGDEWLHEIKYDGYRIGARVKRGRVVLYTRNGNDWTNAFPVIAAAVL